MLLREYLAELKARRYSERTRVLTEEGLKRLFAFLKRKRIRDLRTVSAEDLTTYALRLSRKKTRYGRPPAIASMITWLSVVRRFFRFLARRKRILGNPAQDLLVPKRDALPRGVLNVTQARRVMIAPTIVNPRWWVEPLEKRNRAIVEVLYGTGIRLSECTRLDVGDLDLFQSRLWVRNGKGRKDRVVPVPRCAAEALDVYLRDVRVTFAGRKREEGLFLTAQGVRLQGNSIRVMLCLRAQRAKVDAKVTPHGLRQSCATHLLRGGAQLRHVQELLGHSNIETTAIYTRVAVKDLSEIIERCHPREKTSKPRRMRGAKRRTARARRNTRRGTIPH